MATIIDRYKLIIDTNTTNAGLNNLSSKLKGIGGIIAGAFAVDKITDMGRAIVDVGKKYETMRNQLKLVTTSQAELNDVFGKLQQVSNRTFSGLDDTVDLFQKLTLSTQSLGATTDQVIAVTQNFQSALALSGADANTASAAIRQFGQAMASGVVRGDEFTSIVEALGPALAIMGQESGLTIGKLREMSQAGELTAKVMLDIFENADKVRQVMASLTVTTDQLESTLGKTFDEVINKLDKATGVTSTYRSILQGLNRTFADLFNTSTSLAQFSPEELFRMAAEEGQNFDTVLYELQQRLEDVAGFYFPGFGFSNQEEVDAIQAIIDKLKDLQQQRQEDKRLADEQAREAAAEEARVNALLEPYAKLTERLKEIGTAYENARPKAERLAEQYDSLKNTLNELNELRGTEVGQLIKVDEQIATVTGRMTQLKEEMNSLKEPVENNAAAFEKFYNSLIEDAEAAVTESDFVAQAILRLQQQFEAGLISLELYNQGLELLGEGAKNTVSEFERLQERLVGLQETAEDSIRRARDNAELAGLSGIEKDLRSIELAQDRITEKFIANARAQLESGKITVAQYEKIVAEARALNDETTKTLQNSERVKQQNEERVKAAQRTFSYGWNQAFKQYADDATNAARTAESLFRKTTQGMEDLFVNFAKTGKFEWKTFVQDITDTLLRSQIKGLIADIFGGGNSTQQSGGGLFGFLGDLFGGGSGGAGQQTNDPISSILGGAFGGGTADGSQTRPFYVIPMGGGFGGGGNIVNTAGSFVGGFNTPTATRDLQRIKELMERGSPIGRDMYSQLPPDIQRGMFPFGMTNSTQSPLAGLMDTITNKLFGGFFANGGMIPAGKFGIVGEAGPEFVSGPAQVTPMGGTVNYNINAVDAASFKQLVARDPQFIHSVAALGGSSLPRRRR